MQFMMISCQRATELIDKRQAVGLSPLEHVKLRMHTAMCDMCRRYEKQSTALDGMLDTELRQPPSPPSPDDRARRLAERILSGKK
jgi:hypothetical protein